MKTLTLGIDVGGTNTDFAIVDCHGMLLGYIKTPTSQPIEEGLARGLAQLKEKYPNEYCLIQHVNIGTTQATNAVLEGTRLARVGIIRLCGCRAPKPLPTSNWPAPIRAAVVNGFCAIGGGFECDGRPMSLFSINETEEAIKALLCQGAQALAVVGSFSPLYPSQELEVGARIEKLLGPRFPYTLSHAIGSLGLLERENAAILNSALIPLLGESFKNLASLVQACGIQAEVWMTQNDGTLLSVAEAGILPLKTVAAGPTNSFIGGSKLATTSQAVVVDVGGTSTDIGLVEGGFVRRSLHAATLGGIALNFSMPDLCSLAIGGGTIVEDGAVGRASCGYRFKESAQIFGGQQQTLTDLACLLGLLDISGARVDRVTASRANAERILQALADKVIYEIEKLARGRKDCAVILVGGGTAILHEVMRKRFNRELITAPFAAVANAYGAALAEIGAISVRVVKLADKQVALQAMQEEAVAGAIKQGACPHKTRVTRIEVLPIPYSADHLTKLVVGASGGRMWM